MAGGLQDNRDSESYAFEPKDKPWNWGGLIEPYWIGQNNFGAQSVHVNNTESIPLFASGKYRNNYISMPGYYYNVFKT